MTSITDEELALALPVDYEPREDCSAASQYKRVRRKADEERGPGWIYSLSSKKGGTHYVHVRQPRR